MVVTAVVGHLMNYDFPQEYQKWHSCQPLKLFEAPIVRNIYKVLLIITINSNIFFFFNFKFFLSFLLSFFFKKYFINPYNYVHKFIICIHAIRNQN